MIAYRYLQIQCHEGQRELRALPDVIAWIDGRIKGLQPKAGASSREVRGRPYSHTYRQLGQVDHGVALWLINELGQDGWEPFAADSSAVHLRKAETAEQEGWPR